MVSLLATKHLQPTKTANGGQTYAIFEDISFNSNHKMEPL